MKRQTLVALALASAALPTLAFAETKTLETQPFHGVDVATGIEAVITAGPAVSVVADSSDPNALRDLRWEVRDGTLRLWYDWGLLNLLDFSGRDVMVTISAPLIDSLEASSGASISASAIAADTLTVEVSSGANIKVPGSTAKQYNLETSSGAHVEISGVCDTANVELSSGSGIAAKDLDCAKVDLEASSGSGLEITARESIRADVSSGASATIHGKPSVDALDTDSGGSVQFPS